MLLQVLCRNYNNRNVFSFFTIFPLRTRVMSAKNYHVRLYLVDSQHAYNRFHLVHFSVQVHMRDLRLYLLYMIFNVVNGFHYSICNDCVRAIFTRYYVSHAMVSGPLPRLRMVVLLYRPNNPTIYRVNVPHGHVPRSVLRSERGQIVLFNEYRRRVNSNFQENARMPFSLQPTVNGRVFHSNVTTISFR